MFGIDIRPKYLELGMDHSSKLQAPWKSFDILQFIQSISQMVCMDTIRHGLVATIVVRQIFNEDKNLSQQIHEDKRQKDKC